MRRKGGGYYVIKHLPVYCHSPRYERQTMQVSVSVQNQKLHVSLAITDIVHSIHVDVWVLLGPFGG